MGLDFSCAFGKISYLRRFYS